MIHGNAPSLEVLNLDLATLDKILDTEVGVSRDCTRLISRDGSDIVRTSANNLHSFYLHFKGDWNNPNVQSMIRKWITYIGQKYENAVLLSVEKL